MAKTMKKNDERKRYEISKVVEDCLDANYEHLGGGDFFFLHISAVEDIINACKSLLDSYTSRGDIIEGEFYGDKAEI